MSETGGEMDSRGTAKRIGLGRIAVNVSGPKALETVQEAMLQPGPSKFKYSGLPKFKTTRMENIDLNQPSRKEENNGR